MSKKINTEDLEDFDTSQFLESDEAIVEFLRDIVRDRDPGLLDHAVERIKKRWKSDADKK